MFLVGDVGATKTRLALFDPANGLRSPVREATFPSARYASLEAMAVEFLGQTGEARSKTVSRVERACFGVAGPVVEGVAQITNLPWEITEKSLAAALGIRSARLINDLEAIAYSLDVLEPADLHTLNAGTPVAGGARAVIAPGTGLGEAYLTWENGRYRPHAGEGGHTSFAPETLEQIELLRYLLQRFEHVSFERVCSGIGVPNLYGFLRDRGVAPVPGWLADRLAAAADPTPVIFDAAQQTPPDPLCRATVRMFIEILGAEAGNLALKTGATGGVYLGGGIPPRILPLLAEGNFLRAFCHKGRLSDLLVRIPVQVILNDRAGLIGAAAALA